MKTIRSIFTSCWVLLLNQHPLSEGYENNKMLAAIATMAMLNQHPLSEGYENREVDDGHSAIGSLNQHPLSEGYENMQPAAIMLNINTVESAPGIRRV